MNILKFIFCTYNLHSSLLFLRADGDYVLYNIKCLLSMAVYYSVQAESLRTIHVNLSL